MKGLDPHKIFMKRCFELALRAGSDTKTNPNVGAVIVYKGQIIGEGYHQLYGGPHAEVIAIQSVDSEKRHLIKDAAMYSSLEPCNHYGKTPPCTQMIINQGIKKVYISALDPNPQMKGKSVEILRQKGIAVVPGILEEEGHKIIEPFLINHKFERPFIVLKFAQSADGFMGKEDHQFWFSNHASDILVHKWRSEIDGIMVGTQTAILDNPKLTTRLYSGKSPARIVIDRQGRIPKSHHLLSDDHPSIIFTAQGRTDVSGENKVFQIIDFDDQLLDKIFHKIYGLGVTQLMIEGGARLLKSVIDKNLWDEARIIRTQHILGTGIKAPVVHGRLLGKRNVLTDEILIITNKK